MATDSVAASGARVASGAPASSEVVDKGLKKNAIGYLSNLVIGVASTAPAYSLAATLGFIVAVKGVGVHAPAVLLVSFVPMLLIAGAYRALNRADPDAGTTFAWTTRALGPGLGWVNGWAIFLADVLVMASLAQIAAIYTYKLVAWEAAANSTFAQIVAAVIWIAVMTWICWRGIELSARMQQILLSAEIAILGAFAIVTFIKVYGSPPAALDQAVAVVVQPLRTRLWGTRHRRPARGLHLLGLGFRRGRQRGVRGPQRGTRTRRGDVDDPARVDLRDRLYRRAGLRRHGALTNEANQATC